MTETDEFEISIGKDHRSGNLFAVKELRLGMLKEFEVRHQPIDMSKVDVDVLQAVDYGSIEDWMFSTLKVEPFKRYRFKITVELIKEVPKI